MHKYYHYWQLVINFILFSFQMKPDKWAKLMSQDESTVMMSEFLDKGDSRVLIITLSSAGALQCSNEFPTTLKNKSIYFVKRYVDHSWKTMYDPILNPM